MPKGISELIEFLLEKIALCGEQGASVKDYKSFVEQFYTPPDTCPLSTSTSIPNSANPAPPRANERLQQHAWDWLTAHDDIWVGHEREGNRLTLVQVETREVDDSFLSRPESHTRDSASHQSEQQSQQPNASNATTKTARRNGPGPPLRIWTTRDRVWQAVAGHGVDFKRISPLEFNALCFIAAAGEKGIIQPELTQLTGQDKRSLPKRTDVLAAGGYIEKTVILVKSQKTSLLRLRRFASTDSQTKEVFRDGHLVFNNLLASMCEWLKDGAVITLSDLEERLHCVSTGWAKKALWKALERLDIVGIIQRFHRPIKHIITVKPKKGKERTLEQSRKQKCIRLLREPTAEDEQRYYNLTTKDREQFRRRLEAMDAEARKEHAEHEEDDDFAPDPDSPGTSTSVVQNYTDELESLQDFTAQWDPDLPYTTNLFNVVNQGSSAGMSTMELRGRVYGKFYHRAVDGMLGKITDDWEKAQPSSLRHLNIIRDTGSRGKYTHYVYRTHGQFQEAVDKLETSWDVATRPENNAAPHSVQQLDNWGFPVINSSQVIRDGRATLGECLAAAKVELDTVKSHDPVLVKHVDGTIGASWVKAVSISRTPNHRASRRSRLKNQLLEIAETLPEAKAKNGKFQDQSAYNAAYRKMQRLRQQAEDRARQIRRQAERVGYEEALAWKNSIDNQTPSKVVKPTFVQQRGTLPSLVIVDDVDQEDSSLQDNATASAVAVASEQSTPVATPGALNADSSEKLAKTRKLRPKLYVKESRIRELVVEFGDISRNAVHINPLGSMFDEKVGTAFRKQLMVVFKFPWLKSFNWFVPDPVSRPQVVEQTSLSEPCVQETGIVEVNNDSDADDETVFIDTPPLLLDTSSELTPARRKTKPQTGKPSLLSPSVYVKNQRGRPAKDAPTRLNLALQSDHLHEHPLNQRSTGTATTTSTPSTVNAQVGVLSVPPSIDPSRPISNDITVPPVYNSPWAPTGSAIYGIERLNASASQPRKPFLPLRSQKEPNPMDIDANETLPPFVAHQPADANDDDSGIHDVLKETSIDDILRSSNYDWNAGKPSKTRLDRRKKGITLGSGAVARKRTLMVMEMLDKCGGLFPGDTEIIAPYQRFQAQKGEKTKSDRDTILKAVQNLIKTGKLKRIGFAFPIANGKMETKHLLLKPEIASNAPEVQAMISEMRKAYPLNYIPPGLEDDVRKSGKVINRYVRAEKGPVKGPDGQALPEATFALDITEKRKQLETRRQATLEQARDDEQKRLQERLEKNQERQSKWHNKNKDESNLRPWFRIGSSVSGSESGHSRRGRTTSIAFEGGGPATFSYDPRPIQPGAQQAASPRDGKTLGELLAGMGSFAPAFVPDTDENIFTSIENDLGPMTRGRLRNSGQQQRVSAKSVNEDFWVHDDPTTIRSRHAPSERSSSVYSFDVFDTKVQRERRLSSAASDNAVWSQQKPIDLNPRKRQRLNEAANTGIWSGPGHTDSTPYHRSFVPMVPRRTDMRNTTTASRSLLIHDIVQFKPPFGPERYNPYYNWQQFTTLLDPDQRFDVNTGTFSTEFFVRRGVREYTWVQTPAQLTFENFSLVNEADCRILSSADDWDNHYHPDKHNNRRTSKATRQFYADSDDDDSDVIQRAWFEREELARIQEEYPGLAFGRKEDGFVNFSLAHEQELSKDPIDKGSHQPGSNYTMYGNGYGTPNHGGPAMSEYLPLPPLRQRLPAGNRFTPGKIGPTSSAAPTLRTTRIVKQSGKCFISPEVAKRLLFAMIAVRAIAGGVDQTIRWPFIADIFAGHPNYDQPTFKARWLRMVNNHRALLSELEQDFRDKFLVAYARNQVPRTDVRDLSTYDWNFVIDWAIKNVPIFPDDVTLPARRDLVDENFDVQIVPRPTQEMREKLEHSMATNFNRELLTHELLFALPLRPRQVKKSKSNASKDELAVARSWARACSATPDSAFNSQLAEAKLKMIHDSILKEALGQLHAEKVIAHQYQGRLKPGRNYRLAESYSSLFSRRQLDAPHFFEAVAFKKHLDECFSRGEGVVLLRGDAKDGDILALTDMCATGRLEIRPRLPQVNSTIGDPWPRLSIWGFSEGHYRLRVMDKRVFYWDVEISPTEKYVCGLPIERKIAEVRPPMGPVLPRLGLELCPIWYDIHGNLIQNTWANLVRCVAQSAAIKAGSSIEVLTAPFKGMIWEWEVKLCAEWLVELGVAKWIGGRGRGVAGGGGEVGGRDGGEGDGKDGLMMLEWWWTVIPEGGGKVDGTTESSTTKTPSRTTRTSASR